MSTEIITTEDLKAFKVEMLDAIKHLLAENGTAPTKQWYKSLEVRELLDISPGTLQNLRDNGTLPYTKVGGTLFYAHKDICQMFEENKSFDFTRFR